MNTTIKNLILALSFLCQLSSLLAQELNIKDLLHFKEVVASDTAIFVHSTTKDTLVTKIEKWISPTTGATLHTTDLIIIFEKKIKINDASYYIRAFPLREDPSELAIKVISVKKHKQATSIIEHRDYFNHHTITHPVHFIRSGEDRFLEICQLTINPNGDTELNCKRTKLLNNHDCLNDFKPIFIHTMKTLYAPKAEKEINTEWLTLEKYMNSPSGSEKIFNICDEASTGFHQPKVKTGRLAIKDSIELDVFYLTDTVHSKKAIRKLNRIKKKEERNLQHPSKWRQKRLNTLKRQFKQKYIVPNSDGKLLILDTNVTHLLNSRPAQKIIKQNVKVPKRPKNLKYGFSLLIKGNTPREE